MNQKYENMSFFEQLQTGLEESIAHAKGRLSLKTTTLPSPPPKIGCRQIVFLRNKLKMSQAYFAATLNVSPKTVQSWEQGSREPSDAALRMLQIVRDNPNVIGRILTNRNGATRNAVVKSRNGKTNPVRSHKRRRTTVGSK